MGGCAGKFKTADGLKSPASKSADGAKEAVINTENSKSLAEVKINEPTQTDKNGEDKDAKEPFVEAVKDANGEGKGDAKEQAAEGKKSEDVKKEEAVSA
ncbi:hypothetical protein KSP40_PGU000434 [Platanthera guangdongensis]|uniref:Cold-regulated protein n=1 Tax=Platanthera guangdongensis TaxID=2320717 RepID=A0ABR2MHX5_9ASPA